MKIYLKKEKLEQVLGQVSKVINQNASTPALQGVRITTKPHIVIFEGTNIEMSIEVRLGGESDGEVTCVIPIKTFFDVVKLLPPGEVILDISQQTCVVITKQGKITITLLPSEEFPTLPKTHNTTVFQMKKKDIISGFQSVLYAVSQSTIKPELASVFIGSDGTSLVFVATDSFRLAEKKIPFISESEFPPILVPNKNCVELVSFLNSTEDDDVDVCVDDDMCSFQTSKEYITSRLTSGTFPDYRKILPTTFSTTAIILREDIATVLKKVAVLSDHSKQVHIAIDVATKKIVCTSKNSTTGALEEEVVGTVEGVSIGLNFNQRYISDCFQSIPVDTVSFSFSGPGKPLVIRGVSDASFLYLVMPMNK
jgi:DNA polymerase-3 subunit beta